MLTYKEQINKEKDFFKSSCLCNNNKLEIQNHEIFQRIYSAPVETRVEVRKLPNENRISEQGQVIDIESDLYTLQIDNTKCPSEKYQKPIIKNPNISNNINLYGMETNNLVGIHNKLPNSNKDCNDTIENYEDYGKKYNNVDVYSNTLNVCSTPPTWNSCQKGSYMRGTYPAAAQSDVRYGKLHDEKSKNYWLNYVDVSNTSSDTLYNHKKIGNRMTHYTIEQSLPFMLEDVRVRKIPETNVSCTDLFNNMTRRKSLFS